MKGTADYHWVKQEEHHLQDTHIHTISTSYDFPAEKCIRVHNV